MSESVIIITQIRAFLLGIQLLGMINVFRKSERGKFTVNNAAGIFMFFPILILGMFCQ